MKRIKQHIVLACFLTISGVTNAQFSYTLMHDVDVIEEDQLLSMPWAGGINSVQVNMMDLNGDNVQDLVLFERTLGTIKTMVFENDQWVAAPQYIDQFPSVSGWMLLRDYNNDGRKDLFTSHPLGIRLYQNISDDNNLQWRSFNNGKELTTQGLNGPVNILVASDDIPAIDDINGDGLLDIISVAFLSNSIEFNQNVSAGDTLALTKVTSVWGDFRECACGSFAFGEPCAVGGRIEHTQPKSIITYDMDGDGDKDLAISEELCSEIHVLENIGDKDNAILRNPANTFPNSRDRVRLFYYPSAFQEDIDHDGKKDMIVTTNISTNYGLFLDFKSNVHFYKNISTTEDPNYVIISKNYLHSSMIDVGENSVPAFADVDYDGDEDMIVGRWGQYSPNGRISTLYLYENTGSNLNPSFKLINTDWLELSRFAYFNLKPQFVDINGDQNLDIAFSASPNNQFDSYVYYILNNSFWGFDFTNVSITHTGIIVDLHESAYFYDYDNDMDADLLVGESSGRVRAFRNVINNNVIGFHPAGEFYHLGPDNNRPFPRLSIGDLNGNEVDDLVVAARNGHFSIYPDFKNDLDNPVDSVAVKLFVSDDVEVNSSMLGSSLAPVISRLHNRDLKTLVVGNGQGGLSILQNNNSISLGDEGRLNILPTLVHVDNDEIQISSTTNVLVEVLTLTGQKVTPFLKRMSGNKLNIPVANLAPGMYIVRVFFNPDELMVKKIVVTR